MLEREKERERERKIKNKRKGERKKLYMWEQRVCQSERENT